MKDHDLDGIEMTVEEAEKAFANEGFSGNVHNLKVNAIFAKAMSDVETAKVVAKEMTLNDIMASHLEQIVVLRAMKCLLRDDKEITPSSVKEQIITNTVGAESFKPRGKALEYVDHVCDLPKFEYPVSGISTAINNMHIERAEARNAYYRMRELGLTQY